VFCVSVQHAQNVAEQFTAAGFPAFSLDGSLDASVRRDRVSAFRAGRVPVLTSCDLISEGFDVPGIEVGISLRPTASLGLWLQQIGRCLRIAPGKSEALILDHAGNSLRHGLPTDDHEWSLTHGVAEHKGEAKGGIKVCGECWATNARTRQTCSECGAPFKVSPREIAHVEGELTELQAADARRVARMDQGQKQTLDDLIALGKIRGYKNPVYWAKHVMAGRARKGAA
jgi:superfamily II DNA or RNA helicase